MTTRSAAELEPVAEGAVLAPEAEVPLPEEEVPEPEETAAPEETAGSPPAASVPEVTAVEPVGVAASLPEAEEVSPPAADSALAEEEPVSLAAVFAAGCARSAEHAAAACDCWPRSDATSQAVAAQGRMAAVFSQKHRFIASVPTAAEHTPELSEATQGARQEGTGGRPAALVTAGEAWTATKRETRAKTVFILKSLVWGVLIESFEEKGLLWIVVKRVS